MTQTNHYCVPTALSILTSIPVDAVEKILKDVYLGDVEIEGVYLGLALKFLSDNGYEWSSTIWEGYPLKSQTTYSNTKHEPILIEIRGHALVSKSGIIYDNSYPEGIEISKYPRAYAQILRAYRISHV